MQRVVRLSFVGLLAIAGASFATACGDKVTVPPAQPQDSVVHTVTVSPPNANLNIGDKFQFGAAVDAGTGVKDRTVTWSSSNSAVASVDQTGLVTAVSGGNASIVAKSKADPNVSGAASVTVAAVVHATVNIGQINQTTCGFAGCSSAPAQLGNVANQLDVTLNVDPGTEKISEVDLLMNCGGADTLVGKQTFASTDIAPIADASSSPVTISFNTAAFNPTTGAVAFKNGACTLKAKAITTTGTQSAVSSTQVTLNNADTVSAQITTTPVGAQKASATDAAGLLWKAGTVTVTAVPVIYSAGFTAASGSISLVNISGAAGTKGSTVGNVPNGGVVASQTGITPTSGAITATFPKDMTAAGVDSTTVAGVGVAVTTVTSAGNPGPAIAASQANMIRLDNLAPPNKVAIHLNAFNGTNNWLGKSFVFSTASGSVSLGSTPDSAAADNGGVDVVTFTTQWRNNGASSSTFATFTSVASLAETSASSGTGSYDFRLVLCDALNNCTNGTATNFGVDLTTPSVVETSVRPVDHQIFNIDSAGVVPATATFNVVDTSNTAGITPSGPPLGQEVLVTLQGLQPNGATGSQTICPIGNTSGSGTAITCKSPITQNQGAVPLPNTAGEYTMTVIGIDQAGNMSTPITLRWYVDVTAPAVSGGVTIPNPITAGTSFALGASDNMDVAAGAGSLEFPNTCGATTCKFFEGTSAGTGVTFDNVLTRTGTVNVVLNTFFRGLANTINTAGTPPGNVNARAVDAAGNISANFPIALPAGNMSAPGTISNAGAAGITAAVALAVPAADTVGQTVALTDSLTAVSGTSASPFTQVCFYYQAPTNAPGAIVAGELIKIACTSSLSAVGSAPRVLGYGINWTVPAILRGQTVNIFAVGQTSSLDALITPINGGSITVAP